MYVESCMLEGRYSGDDFMPRIVHELRQLEVVSGLRPSLKEQAALYSRLIKSVVTVLSIESSFCSLLFLFVYVDPSIPRNH